MLKMPFWGGFTIGLILSFLVVIFLFFQGNGFDWHIIGKWAIVFTSIGFGAELLAILGNLLKKK